MTRPILTHDGFLIPNAAGVSNSRMAEPDQIDFNTIAHALWGVVEGCLVTCAGSTATTTGGLAIVNGKLVTVNGQSQTLGIGGVLDRFDLLVVDQGGTLLVVRGDESTDPVFKDVSIDTTVLAAVFVPTGTSNLADNVIDKRKFVAKNLLTKIAASDPLIQNRNGTGDHFYVTGGGTMTWEGDTTLERTSAGKIRIRNLLQVDDAIAAGGAITGETLSVAGKVTSSNLKQQTAVPSVVGLLPGTLFQNQTNGRIFALQNGAWNELATISGAVPVGTVITSVQPKEYMNGLGWLPLDGSTISEDQYPNLFGIASLGTVTGTAPHRSMKLPNAGSRVLMTNWSNPPGFTGGPAGNLITLTLSQMPTHKHDVNVTPDGGGPITVTLQPAGDHAHAMDPGGEHIHWVNEHPHAHQGMNHWGTASPVISVFWGGHNKIDALFNDRNHTYSVEAADWTMPAVGEVDVLSNGSAHGHVIKSSGLHTHPASAAGMVDHDHAVTESNKGSGASIDITPQYITFYAYIRS